MGYLNCGFDQLSELNEKRAIDLGYPIDHWSPMQWGDAMAGEFGELGFELLTLLQVCNTIKKLERGRPEDIAELPALYERIGLESADIVIYLDLMLKRVDSYVGAVHILADGPIKKQSLRDFVRAKFNLTSKKFGSSITW